MGFDFQRCLYIYSYTYISVKDLRAVLGKFTRTFVYTYELDVYGYYIGRIIGTFG